MKIILALMAAAVIFGYPIADSSASESRTVELPQEVLKDSISRLRRFADQQTFDNAYKMQELQISIAELEIINNKIK